MTESLRELEMKHLEFLDIGGIIHWKAFQRSCGDVLRGLFVWLRDEAGRGFVISKLIGIDIMEWMGDGLGCRQTRRLALNMDQARGPGIRPYTEIYTP